MAQVHIDTSRLRSSASSVARAARSADDASHMAAHALNGLDWQFDGADAYERRARENVERLRRISRILAAHSSCLGSIASTFDRVESKLKGDSRRLGDGQLRSGTGPAEKSRLAGRKGLGEWLSELFPTEGNVAKFRDFLMFGSSTFAELRTNRLVTLEWSKFQIDNGGVGADFERLYKKFIATEDVNRFSATSKALLKIVEVLGAAMAVHEETKNIALQAQRMNSGEIGLGEYASRAGLEIINATLFPVTAPAQGITDLLRGAYGQEPVRYTEFFHDVGTSIANQELDMEDLWYGLGHWYSVPW